MTRDEKLREILDDLLANWTDGKVDNPDQAEAQIEKLFALPKELKEDLLKLIMEPSKNTTANHLADVMEGIGTKWLARLEFSDE